MNGVQTWVINLDRAPERLARIRSQLDALGFLHEYDLGDGWHHDVTVQAIELADEERNSWPMCLAGANACPPEDVGGLGGYEEFLQAVGDPSHEQHDAMRRWCGGPFDPKGFDINSANRSIRDWMTERG